MGLSQEHLKEIKARALKDGWRDDFFLLMQEIVEKENAAVQYRELLVGVAKEVGWQGPTDPQLAHLPRTVAQVRARVERPKGEAEPWAAGFLDGIGIETGFLDEGSPVKRMAVELRDRLAKEAKTLIETRQADAEVDR